jgi:hypothetical protein
MSYTMIVYFLAGAIAVNGSAGPWESATACEQAAAKTRRYARMFVDKVEARCVLEREARKS